jgi:hypothetical protein
LQGSPSSQSAAVVHVAGRVVVVGTGDVVDVVVGTGSVVDVDATRLVLDVDDVVLDDDEVVVDAAPPRQHTTPVVTFGLNWQAVPER